MLVGFLYGSFVFVLFIALPAQSPSFLVATGHIYERGLLVSYEDTEAKPFLKTSSIFIGKRGGQWPTIAR